MGARASGRGIAGHAATRRVSAGALPLPGMAERRRGARAALPARGNRRDAEWPAQIAGALSTVGLTGHENAKVETFSKGMQQRLGLGVALLGNPELVILDEPTSALDPVGRADTRAIIRHLRDRGCAVFLNSHLLGEVEQICDRAAVVVRRTRPGDRTARRAARQWRRAHAAHRDDRCRARSARASRPLAEHDRLVRRQRRRCRCGARPGGRAGREWRPGLCRRAGPPDARGAVPHRWSRPNRRDGSADHRAAHDSRGRPAKAAARARDAHRDRDRTHRLGLPAPDHAHQSRRQSDPRGRTAPCDVAGAGACRIHVQWRARTECRGRRVSGDLERARVGCRAVDPRAPGEPVPGGARKVARARRAHRHLRCSDNHDRTPRRRRSRPVTSLPARWGSRLTSSARAS